MTRQKTDLFSTLWGFVISSSTHLRYGHHDAVAGASDGRAHHHPHRLARTVGEEDVVRVRAVAVAAFDEIAHLKEGQGSDNIHIRGGAEGGGEGEG